MESSFARTDGMRTGSIMPAIVRVILQVIVLVHGLLEHVGQAVGGRR
jgi:hypothetical protein